MISGYVLIDTKISYEREVADKLSLINEVVDVEPLFVEEGALADPFFKDYDLIIKIKAESSSDFKKILDSKIKTIHGVNKTSIASKPN